MAEHRLIPNNKGPDRGLYYLVQSGIKLLRQQYLIQDVVNAVYSEFIRSNGIGSIAERSPSRRETAIAGEF